MNIPKNMIDSLIATAEEQTAYERWDGDLSRFDSLDNAYDGGSENGEIHATRQLLKGLGVEYTVVGKEE